MAGRSTKATAAAICAGIALLGGAAGAQGAKGEYETAKFKLSVKGKQTTTEKSFHDPINDCDIRNYSTGKEVVRFSTKPVKATVVSGPGMKTPIVAYGKGKIGMAATAKVNRSFNPAISGPAGRDCGDNGGGGEPLPPDCGTRTVKPWQIQLDWPRRQRVGLEAGWVDDQLYKNCPGGAFPDLITQNTLSGPIDSELPDSELFDEKIGKLIVIGKGEQSFLLHDYDETTKLRWEITLKRIKG